MTPDDTSSVRAGETPLSDGLAPPPNEKYAFVSYKSEDRARVGPIVDGLRNRGIPVWWDDSIQGGAKWATEIKRRLDDAEVVVAVWSDRSVSDDGYFVQEEARTAIKDHRLVPVKIDAVDPPLGFGEFQAIDLSAWKERATDPRFERLVTDVGAKLHATITPAPVDPWHVRVVRKYGIGLVAIVVVAAAAWGVQVITAGPTAADLYKKMVDRDLGSNERALAIKALDSLQRAGDSVRLTENHRQVIQFLAWRAKRAPFIECDAAAATLQAATLTGEPDVEAAVAYLRSSSRTILPAGALSLDSVNLQKQNFSGADLRHTTFKAACLDGATFTDARLEGSAFDNAHLTRASFVRARLDSAQLGLTQLDTTSWFNACLRHANFAGANLSGADFRRAVITWANFGDAYGEVQRGWAVVDTTPSTNARFVGTRDVKPDDRAVLERAGASFTADYDQWNARRATAVADTGTRACRPAL